MLGLKALASQLAGLQQPLQESQTPQSFLKFCPQGGKGLQRGGLHFQFTHALCHDERMCEAFAFASSFETQRQTSLFRRWVFSGFLAMVL